MNFQTLKIALKFGCTIIIEIEFGHVILKYPHGQSSGIPPRLRHPLLMQYVYSREYPSIPPFSSIYLLTLAYVMCQDPAGMRAGNSSNIRQPG